MNNIPICLRVEIATSFLKSVSMVAVNPATNIVKRPTQRSKNWRGMILNKKWNFNKTTTPAVTNVEEWTRALTGVGAAMAAGSHAEIGAWALLVIEIKIISNNPQDINNILLVSPAIQPKKPNKTRKITSPIRFLNKVKTLEFNLFQFS